MLTTRIWAAHAPCTYWITSIKVKYKKKKLGKSWLLYYNFATILQMLAKHVKFVGQANPLLLPTAVINRLLVFALILKASAPCGNVKRWWAERCELEYGRDPGLRPPQSFISPSDSLTQWAHVSTTQSSSEPCLGFCCEDMLSFSLKTVYYTAARRHSWHTCCQDTLKGCVEWGLRRML